MQDVQFDDQYSPEEMEKMIFDLCSCNNDITVSGKMLYCLVKYKALGKYHHDFIVSLFRDKMVNFEQATDDEYWRRRLFIYQLTGTSCNKITKLLIKHNVFNERLRFTDYYRIVPSYYDEHAEEMSLSELFIDNIKNGNVFRVNLQIQFSDVECMKNISNYLDEDMDCDLTVLNTAACYCENNKYNMVKFLLKHKFPDEYTTNSYRKVLRPLCCVETASFYGDIELTKILVKANTDDFFDNLSHMLKYKVMRISKISEASRECVRRMLTIEYTSEQKKELCEIMSGVNCATPEMNNVYNEFLFKCNRQAFCDSLHNNGMQCIDRRRGIIKASDRVFGIRDMEDYIGGFLAKSIN